jgi:hypothetical protein
VYSGMALSDTFYSVRRESHMGVYRIRSGSVGRPFTKGNPGGGRPKGAQNKATLEIKEFARNFLMSDRYQRTLERRILAGTAPHMEVLLHHYAFGKPTHKYVAPAPAPRQNTSYCRGCRSRSSARCTSYRPKCTRNWRLPRRGRRRLLAGSKRARQPPSSDPTCQQRGRHGGLGCPANVVPGGARRRRRR